MSALRPVPDLLERYALAGMCEEHLDQVLAIERMSYSNPWPRDAFVHEIEENPLSRPRVAVTRDEMEVAAYCVSWFIFEQLHIHNVAVHPRHRRLGLARMLIARALEEGRERGVRVADLEVRPSNIVATKLYESLGFRVTGRRKGYYSRPREDALLLRKNLPRPSLR